MIFLTALVTFLYILLDSKSEHHLNHFDTERALLEFCQNVIIWKNIIFFLILILNWRSVWLAQVASFNDKIIIFCHQNLVILIDGSCRGDG